MKYKFLSHTADIKFQAFGTSVEEMFENSALAMFSAMCKKKVKSVKKHKVKASGKDFESLLYNFLEELLVLFDGEGFFLGGVKKLEISKEVSDKGSLINQKQKGRVKKGGFASGDDGRLKLEAEVVGDDARNYVFDIDVKAITYHEMFVKQEKGGWVCQVVVDV